MGFHNTCGLVWFGIINIQINMNTTKSHCFFKEDSTLCCLTNPFKVNLFQEYYRVSLMMMRPTPPQTQALVGHFIKHPSTGCHKKNFLQNLNSENQNHEFILGKKYVASLCLGGQGVEFQPDVLIILNCLSKI